MTQTNLDDTPNVQNPVAAKLVQRHLSHIKAINERDWEALAGYQCHVAQNFTADIMYSESVESYADYIEAFRNVTATAPDFQIIVLNVNTTLQEHLGRAEVYMLAKEEGRAQGVVSHGMSKLEWREEVVGDNTEWFLYRHTMFRGVKDAVEF